MPPKAKPAIGAKKPIVNENGVGRSVTVQKNAVTEVVVKVNQKQSLNIVQTSVAASLSTILYIKNLFPEYYFEHRSYSFKSPNFSYEVTPADARALKRQKEDDTTVSWDMLVPGKHRQIDKMLYWLDGIGEAIKLQYLASFVISIHHGRITPDTLKEAYVLNFSYKGPEQRPQVGFTIGNETVDITLQNQQDMKTLFQRLLTLANNHGVDLPANPAIGMQLTYNDTCPKEYEPPGFRAAPPSKWIDEAAPTVIGELRSGYHTLEMRMLRPPSLPAMAAMPPKAPYALDAELNLDSSSQISTAKAVRMAPLPPKMPRNPGPSLNLDSSPSKSQYTESIVGTPLKGPRGQVHHMIRHNQAGVFDTQLAGGVNHEIQDTAQRNEESSAAVEERHLVQDRRDLAEPVGRLVCFDRTTDLSIGSLTSRASLSPTNADSNCVCGKNKEGEVHACQGCGAFQHRKCYGLVDSDMLNTFICYLCLLKVDQPLLRQMKNICQLRSLLAIIASEGYPLTESELAKPTGYLVREVKTASAKLAEEGYLLKVFRPGQNKAKAFRKGPLLPPYEFDETQRGRLLREYWNPAYKVEAFVRTMTQMEIPGMMNQPQDKMKDAVIPPTPPSFKPQPPMKPLVAKSDLSRRGMMSMDDDDDDDDDLSSSRREVEFSDAKGSSSRTGSSVRLQPLAKKRKGEDLGDQGPGKKALKTSTPKSPVHLSSP